MDRVHDEPPLHRGERAHARVATLQLLHDEPVGDVVEPRAAVRLGQIRAEQPQLRHLRDQVLREFPLEVVLADDRGDVVVHPLAHRVADGALFLGKEAVDVVEVDAVESGHVNLGG